MENRKIVNLIVSIRNKDVIEASAKIEKLEYELKALKSDLERKIEKAKKAIKVHDDMRGSDVDDDDIFNLV